jgi:4-aminobutyrate aminotransferase-like enzyme
MEKHHLVENCYEQGDYFLKELCSLSDFKIVGDVRGKGLMAGVEFVKDKKTKEPFPVELEVAEKVMNTALDKGLIIYAGHGSVDGVMGDHILLGPPLTINRKQIDEMITILKESLLAVEKQLSF